MDNSLISIAKGIARQIAENVRAAKRNFIFDVAILLSCFVLFQLNQLVIKPALSPGAWVWPVNPSTFLANVMHFHFNDFLGGLSFMAYTNLLLDVVRPDVRFRSLKATLIYMLFCGCVWEFIAPLFIAHSTSDILDLLAYLLGAFLYWGFWRQREK